MRSSILAFAAAMTFGAGLAVAQSPTPPPSTAPAAKPTAPPTTPAAKPTMNKQLSDAECTAAWQKAIGGSKSTSLDEMGSKSYVPNFKAADSNGDKKLDQNEWKSACSKGLVVASADHGSSSAKSGEHPPTKAMDKMVPPMKAN